MNKSFVKRQATLIAVAVLLLAGCDVSSTPTDQSTDSDEKVAGRENVTFYIAGMNDRMNIF